MRSAVVVGAGVGGLAAAGGLARAGWRVTLLERAERLRGDSAGMLLWPNGVRALRALDVAGGLGTIAVPVPARGVRRPGGEWLVRPEEPGDERHAAFVVHREDLHDALVAGLSDTVDVRTGVTVTGVYAASNDAPAVATGSANFEADLVIAADGLDSVLRRRLAPESTLVPAGCAAWRALIPWFRAPRLPGDAGPVGETLGAGHRFRYATLGEAGAPAGRGGIYWAATVPGAHRPEPAATQLTLLRRWFAGWHPPIGDLLAATQPEDLIQHEVGELRPLPRAFSFAAGSGGFVLLGDAAHAMSHHLGQGGCLALEDAATLRGLMLDAQPGPSLSEALHAYTHARRPRMARIMRQSRRLGAVLSASGGLAVRARDAALGLSPGLLSRASNVLGDWRPPT